LDDWFEDGQPIAATAIFELVLGGEFASAANLDWYVTELRRWRVVRGLRLLAWDLSQIVDEKEPLEVLDWIGDSLEQLKVVAEPLKVNA
jgi:hypothetical protein